MMHWSQERHRADLGAETHSDYRKLDALAEAAVMQVTPVKRRASASFHKTGFVAAEEQQPQRQQHILHNDRDDRRKSSDFHRPVDDNVPEPTPRILPPISQLTESLYQSRPSVSQATEYRSQSNVDHARNTTIYADEQTYHAPARPVLTSRSNTFSSSSIGLGRPEDQRSILHSTPCNLNDRGVSDSRSQGNALTQETAQNFAQNTHLTASRHIAEPDHVGMALSRSAFRRDMERVEDWASRLYYLAAHAAPGTGNFAPLKPVEPRSEVQFPSQHVFDEAIEQARAITEVMQQWRTAEYGTGMGLGSQSNAGASLSREALGATNASALFQRQGTTQSTTSSAGGMPTASWDVSDMDAMKHRKRSAPKSINPLVSNTASSQALHERPAVVQVARSALPGRCHSCNSSETPEWRRGPDGARTLCNACGLHFAKVTKRKQQAAEQHGPPPHGHHQ